MEVILNQDVKNLGYADDVVKVKNGFGRNFLIPKGMAVIANESNRKAHEEVMRQRSFKAEKLKNAALEIAAKLEKTTVKVATKVGENGRIYGSVTTIQIADSLQKQGHEIDRKQITLDDDHIKTLGTYSATISLHREVKVKMEFEVVEE